MIDVAFDGQLVKAPEVRSSSAGYYKVLQVDVTQRDETTERVSVTAVKRAAKQIPDNLKNGARIYVKGTLSVWRNENGARLSVWAHTIEVLGLIDRRGRRRRCVRGAAQGHGEAVSRLRRRRRKAIETQADADLSEHDSLSAWEQYPDGTIPI